MNDNIYKDLEQHEVPVQFKQRSDLRRIYFDFLSDFRHYLIEFTRESFVETNICELPVSTKPIQLFGGEAGGMHLVIKNQGPLECYISTTGQGGYRLNPGDREKLWLNKPVTAVTVSGSTTLGLIRT